MASPHCSVPIIFSTLLFPQAFNNKTIAGNIRVYKMHFKDQVPGIPPAK